MKFIAAPLGVVLLSLGVLFWLPGAASPPAPPDPAEPGPTSRPLLLDEPVAQGCTTGCAQAHDAVPAPPPAELERLLLACAQEPLAPGSEALETLLFHHRAARDYLTARGTGGLDAPHRDFLERELARETAWLELRVIDEEGRQRVHLPPTRVPLGEKQHLHPPELNRLQPLEISGTVRRVGVKHLWARL